MSNSFLQIHFCLIITVMLKIIKFRNTEISSIGFYAKKRFVSIGPLSMTQCQFFHHFNVRSLQSGPINY